MNTNTKCKQWRMPFLLILFTLFFCWLFCGRYGVFGSKVDWISQHSVFPDYFRQQFYDTGDFFPEFAAGIGGGQNIYNFAYYGLYSPVFLLSYLLPFVKMSDYLIAASFTCLASAVVLLYFWLIKRGFSQTVSFLTALLFLLSAPMIFQSYNQIMFVNYMPFLCMALWGVDSFLEKGKPLLYLSGVFLMIMTSFYFSIGGILVLILRINQRIIAENAQFTGIAAGQGVGFTTGLLHLRKGLGMRETPIRPHSWHCRMQSDYQYDGNRKRPPVWRRHRGSLRPRGRNLGRVEGMTGSCGSGCDPAIHARRLRVYHRPRRLRMASRISIFFAARRFEPLNSMG